MIKLTDEQQIAYNRFIHARNKIRNPKGKWIRCSDYTSTVDITGMNHPLFELNEEYQEYKEAFSEWLRVEPEFRKAERMSMIRGDYDTQDSWKDKNGR
jgi:hypothetical protein